MTPARININSWLPWRFKPSKKTSTIANNPPIKANEMVITKEENNKMAKAPPSAAPDETPIICGPTNGLRKIPCKAAPATANPAPAVPAIRTRGKRTLSTTFVLYDYSPPSFRYPKWCHREYAKPRKTKLGSGHS